MSFFGLNTVDSISPGIMYIAPFTVDYTRSAAWIFFASDDVAVPLLSGWTDAYAASLHQSVAFGKGGFRAMSYGTYSNIWRIVDGTSPQTYRPHLVNLNPGQITLYDNNPVMISYGAARYDASGNVTGAGNGGFMIGCYNDTPRLGDIYHSSDGNVFNIHTDVFPQPSVGVLHKPLVYNPDSGSWLTSHHTDQKFYRSVNNGATWQNPSSYPAAYFGNVVYGDTSLGWAFGDASYNARAIYSSNISSGGDGQTWTANGLGTIANASGSKEMNYINCIHYNEYSQQYVIGGGQWMNQRVDARICTSPTGLVNSWTFRETGTTELTINNIFGDNQGNFVAMGVPYIANSGYTANTNKYFYSKDNAITWTEGTLPISTYADYSRSERMAFGDPALGL